MPNALKLVSFDVVNTILKIHRSPGYQYAMVANQNGVKIATETIDSVYREVWKEKKSEHPTYGLHHGLTPKVWWEDFVCRVFRRSRYSGDEDTLRRISTGVWTHFKTEPASWDVLPHSVDVLKRIRGQGYKTCVISNFDERLTDTLKVLDMHELFDFVVTCMDAGVSKPDPGIYQHALRLAGVGACEALHVGDSVGEDYWAARGVGMRAVILDTDRKLTPQQLSRVPRERVIHKLKDLVHLLEDSNNNDHHL